MPSSLVTWALLVIGVSLAFAGLQTIHLLAVLLWEDSRTVGLRYFGQSLEERRRFKRTLRAHARLLRPILSAASRLAPFDFERASFSYRGISAPKGSCSPESFERAVAYEPRADDVFVVTQMKSGTTWMQHLVYQLFLRGKGDLTESGQALYAVSPWLEGRKSVPLDAAAPLGDDRPSRLIKTHLPARLCPWDARARYIYVARHPVSCFASCADFIAENAGRFSPDPETLERWFCSEKMWWGSWPSHVEGWWRRARESDQVLFVRFEEMKLDLAAVARQVADFLGLSPPGTQELQRILGKCGFEEMRSHAESFEMHPPHILATHARLFVRGAADRHADVPAAVGRRIGAWCAQELEGASYPLEPMYPDVAAFSGECGPAAPADRR